MDKEELVELKDGTTIPLKNVPVSAWRYYGYQLLFSIPILGVICLIAVALFAQNVNIRSFARSYFCGVIIVAILVGLLYLIAAPFLLELIEYIVDMLPLY
jgi:hypothetical protein